MIGGLTGVSRYLRNLYMTMGRMEQIRISYFNGRFMVDTMPPLTDSAQWQNTTRLVRYLPDPIVFGLRTASWSKYEYFLNKRCKKKASCYDIYHETGFTPAKLTQIPTVFSIYDLSLRRYRETHPKDRVWLFEYFIKRRLCYAGHILTISEFIRQEIIDEFKVPSSMVTAVPLAPDPLFFPCRDAVIKKVRKKYNLPESYLLFVSSLEPRKNIDLLIKAIKIARTDIPLVLVGWQGWGEKRWLEKIDGQNLSNQIFITGHIPDDDLRAVYSGAKALVYPSLYEGFGLPIVEAMACNCPVICSNTASMPEVAGDAALLFDPSKSDELAHAIELMVHDTRMRATVVEKGRHRATAFTWNETARQTLEVFKKVLK